MLQASQPNVVIYYYNSIPASSSTCLLACLSENTKISSIIDFIVRLCYSLPLVELSYLIY